ncbi:MFS sugar transporter [Tolypocladium capitatum]|uniref:MFS sugar transporter n=1 Tax=Tolypocladium capitatum TaxID=45235 RepID=A0A2K3QDL5_9HYPO|nr:MFS sugar transporter [Tolypocladium capitatum]
MAGHLGAFRASYLVALSCVGSFLFAYDTGIVGGILTLKSFQDDFGFTAKEKDNVSSLSASLLQAGAFFSCLFAWPFTARFGRRRSIALASLVFNVGTLLQLPRSYGLATWYAGRVIAGVGVGIATAVIPMYSAEMAPKHLRGRLGSGFQLAFTCGVLTSYFVDYGVAEHVAPSSRQWRIPVGLQLVPGGILGLGMLLTRESTRWLAKRGRHQEALDSLIWVRGGEDTTEVQVEFSEILAGIKEEDRVTEGVTWREYLLPANRYRMFLAISIQMVSPQIFNAVGAGQNALLLSGFFGVCKVVSCLFFVLFLVERIGRKGSLLVGSFLMGAYMLAVGLITKYHPPNPGAGLTPPAIASLTMIYLEAMTFNVSWGPVPWLYMSEIFPTRIREGGVAVGAATQWLFNFTFSQITPHAITNLGWRTFLMFCIFNWALVVYTWVFIKETKMRSLEEMELVFNAEHTQIDIAAAHRKDSPALRGWRESWHRVVPSREPGVRPSRAERAVDEAARRAWNLEPSNFNSAAPLRLNHAIEASRRLAACPRSDRALYGSGWTRSSLVQPALRSFIYEDCPRAGWLQTAPARLAIASRPPLLGSTTPPATTPARSFALLQDLARSNMASSVKPHLTPALLREVCGFWFEHLASPDSVVLPTQDDSKRWFFGGEELDRACVERFAPTLEALRASGVTSAADILDAVQPSDPRDWLGLVLLLDQIPRNCYRGASAFVAFTVFDPMARGVSLAAIARGIPNAEPRVRWRLAYRIWFYMPLMHSEDAGAHEAAVAGFERMRRDVYALAEADEQAADADEHRARAAEVVRANVDDAKKLVQVYAGFEERHFGIIKRFGRYPHRNAALGRAATAEEAAYLADGGETFTNK